MQLKHLLWMLICWCGGLQTVSAAIQPQELIRFRDSSVTDSCVRMQMKNYKIVYARINRQSDAKITFTPCFPAGLLPQIVDLEDIIQITDAKGNVLFDANVEGNTRRKNVARYASILSLVGGITAIIGLQLFLIPTYPVSIVLWLLMIIIPVLSVIAGGFALLRYYRGRNFSKRYHWLSLIGTAFSLMMLLISSWLWATYVF